MHKKLDDYLVNKYPKIFANRRKPMTETCMCWGFPDNGWFHLIDNLCSSIQSHLDSHNDWVRQYARLAWDEIQQGKREPVEWLTEEPKEIPQVVAAQVKEKFGGLRFYYDGGDNRIAGMVEMAENMSYHICEICGRFDELVNMNKKGWLRSTCPCCVDPERKEEHLENRKKELVDLWQEVRSEPPKSESEQMQEAFKTLEEVKGYGKE